ncbi:MlaA family lipoprotein [Lysobacter antibioticus]|uniref:MlaA family lipoprotein n=1 Tax=Lysobacter antibioticus TaxID=84531 RepID=UPI0009DDD291|nr:VacJ family lipoprotein [Lysobacter antibioticus]
MRPHALSLSLGLALAALHSVPAFAQDANPASVAEAAVVSATAQTDAALATAPTETLAPADAATTTVDTRQAATAEPALDYALAQVETSQVQPAQPDPNAPAAEAVPPPATAAVEPSAADDQRTEAERDFDALYGTPAQEYDPVADPTLPAPASVPGAFDPWEKYNRKMHRFNMAVDRGVARPLARAYSKVVPRPVRLGVSNFFNNLGQPVSILNALLQGKPKQAAQALGRFALNTTLGIGGIFDPASDAKLPNRSEDFGQTLGVWGWKRSRYVELPFFGPRTVRDSFGALGDAPLSPLRHVERDRIRIPLQGLQLVDVRAQLLPLDSLRDGAEDEYALVRDSWTQRRDYQIFGDRLDKNGDTALPEYLQDDSNPSVPADAMPVMPTDGGR